MIAVHVLIKNNYEKLGFDKSIIFIKAFSTEKIFLQLFFHCTWRVLHSFCEGPPPPPNGWFVHDRANFKTAIKGIVLFDFSNIGHELLKKVAGMHLKVIFRAKYLY